MHKNDFQPNIIVAFVECVLYWGDIWNHVERMKVSHFIPTTFHTHPMRERKKKLFSHCLRSLSVRFESSSGHDCYRHKNFVSPISFSIVYLFPVSFSLSLSFSYFFNRLQRVKGKNKRFLLEFSSVFFFFISRERTKYSLHTFPSNR